MFGSSNFVEFVKYTYSMPFVDLYSGTNSSHDKDYNGYVWLRHGMSETCHILPEYELCSAVLVHITVNDLDLSHFMHLPLT